jgi:Flp pilus assembly protein TadG
MSVDRRSRHNRRKGNAIVEFAFAWAILSFLFSGVYGFGYSLYVYNSLVTAVSGAAKLGAKLDYDVSNTAAYTNAVKNMVLYGDTTEGERVIVPGLTAANINVTPNLVGGIPTQVTVSITNFQVNTIFRNFTFHGKPRLTMLYRGRICSGC